MSESPSFALFPTAIGHCAIAWQGERIVAVQLPEADANGTQRRIARHLPLARRAEQPPPPFVQHAIDAVTASLAGERVVDLKEIALDMRGVPEFHQRVYAIARRIPPGQTRTYGEVAAELGDKQLARAVGQALGANPFAPVVPCHRVLAADGKPGGFSAHGGARAKLRMLAIEGARPGGTAPLFDDIF